MCDVSVARIVGDLEYISDLIDEVFIPALARLSRPEGFETGMVQQTLTVYVETMNSSGVVLSAPSHASACS